MKKKIPEFAVIGHPNEGKSSVLSTLAEDDSVRVSPVPGETRECRTFPVRIDGREIIRFIDTPGFQNPRHILAWIKDYHGPENDLLDAFIQSHRNDPAYDDDCQLLTPLANGAGIIFVVDGSRPVRNVDRIEMEILRLTGIPRMAVINNKEEDDSLIGQWQNEFRKHFNAVRLFNANRATYNQRIALLESLKSIDQELEPVLETVLTAFRTDWAARNQKTSAIIVSMLGDILSHRDSAPCRDQQDEPVLKKRLLDTCTRFVTARERQAHEQIRSLYKHNIFHYDLPEHSILEEDLFSQKTWELLGLNRTQLIMAGALSGAAIGAGVDLTHGGLSLGLYSAIGGMIGAAGTALSSRTSTSGIHLLGVRLDKQQLLVGPVTNIQLMYILLDRTLLFYGHIINWAHGRRDYSTQARHTGTRPEKLGYTARWNRHQQKVCEQFYQSVHQENGARTERSGQALEEMLREVLNQIVDDGANDQRN